MPLLTTFLKSMNSTNRISANLRYCDSSTDRHATGTSSGNICAFVAPEITSLVPEEQRHTRVRNGVNCSHYSFNAIRCASLQARINKRFESIDNDRQENMVDILNSINERSGDSSDLLRKIVSFIDREGTTSKLLNTISDVFSAQGVISEMGRNTTLMTEQTANLIIESQKLRQDFNRYHLENKTLFEEAFDKLIQQNSHGLENMLQINAIGVEMNNKMSSIAESVADMQLASDSVNHNALKEVDSHISEVKEKLGSNEIELSSVKYELQLLGTLFEKNGVEMKQELDELKQELREIKSEMHLIREVITDILPNKLVDAFKIFSDHSSLVGSDLELIDSQRLDDHNESTQ